MHTDSKAKRKEREMVAFSVSLVFAICALVQIGQTIGIGVLYSREKSNNCLWPLTGTNDIAGRGVTLSNVGNLDLCALVLATVAVSAVANGIMTWLAHKGEESAAGKWHVAESVIRWSELAITSTAMSAIVARVAGISDRAALLLLIVLKLMSMGIGFIVERADENDGHGVMWRAIFLAWAIFIFQWSLLLGSYWSMVNDSKISIDQVVHILVMGVFAGLFLVLLWQLLWIIFKFDERAYRSGMALVGLAGKTIFIWTAFNGGVCTR